LTAPFAAIEPNLIIAGIEGAVVVWVCRAAVTGTRVVPAFKDPSWPVWGWAVMVVLALLGILLLGFVVEGMAGITELLVTRRREKNSENQQVKWVLREWYRKWTNQPKDQDWGPGQRWMWKSPQAAHEFARRRVRMTVSRNTAFLFVLLLIVLAGCQGIPHFSSFCS
jgi:hypothetical protein